MKKLIVLLFISGFFALSLYSQEEQLEFTQKKISDVGYTVYFHVTDIQDPEQANAIIEDLLSDDNIFNGRYFKSGTGKDRFQLYINEFVTAEYIRNILLTHDIDYDFSTVSVNGEIINDDGISNLNLLKGTSSISISALGFPKYKNTGNKEVDDEHYSNVKDQWINDNPEEYKSLLKELDNNNK
jgi:hypothetical protein